MVILYLYSYNSEEMDPFDGTMVYARNKRQQVVLTELWQEKEEDTVLFTSCHPGWVDTPAVRTSMPEFHKKMEGSLRTVEQGADTMVWLACADVSKIEGGEFYEDRTPVDKHLLWGGTKYGEEEAEKLWELMEGLEKGIGNTE